MANKLSFDINMNTAGYVQGARQAQQSTKDLEKSTNKYLKEFGSLRKELSAAKKEAYNLAMEFSQLSKTEKESEIGKQMSEDLNLAIQKAGELQDVLGDTNEAIKNVASDTAGLDGFKDALDIGKSAATGLAGAIAKVTGNDKALTDVVSNLAMIEGGFNTVLKISNQLQNNATIITSLQKTGVISLTQAQKLQTAATKAQTAATVALSTAMKALPWIALAAGVVVAGNALIDYVNKQEKAKYKTQEVGRELTEQQKYVKDLANTYNNTWTNSLGSTISKYEQLRREYTALTSKAEQIEWFKKHKDACQELNLGINNLIDADKVFVKESANVISVLRIRAQMMAEATRNADLYAKQQQAMLDAEKNIRQFSEGEKIQGDDISRYGLQKDIDYIVKANEIGGYYYTAAGAVKANSERLRKNIVTYTKDISSALEQSNKRLDSLATELNNIIGGLGTGGSSGTGTSISKGVKEQKLKVELPVEIDDSKLYEKFKKIDDKFNTIDGIKFDFSGLSDSMREEAESIVSDIDKIINHIKELNDLLSEAKDPALISAIKGEIDGLNVQLEKSTEAAARYGEASEKNNAYADYIKKDAEAYGYYAQMVQGVSNALSVLGETEAAQMAQFTANSAALVMDAIKTITAMNAEALAKGASSAFALPFPANLAAWATVLTTITSIFANLPKFSEGGIVHGKGSIGDFNLVRANDGEAFFNTRQQKRLFDLANGTGYIGNNTLHIIGTTKVNGSDLDIVWTNYNRINKRAR